MNRFSQWLWLAIDRSKNLGHNHRAHTDSIFIHTDLAHVVNSSRHVPLCWTRTTKSAFTISREEFDAHKLWVTRVTKYCTVQQWGRRALLVTILMSSLSSLARPDDDCKKVKPYNNSYYSFDIGLTLRRSRTPLLIHFELVIDCPESWGILSRAQRQSHKKRNKICGLLIAEPWTGQDGA